MNPSPNVLFLSPITLDVDLSFLAAVRDVRAVHRGLEAAPLRPALMRLFEERERRTEGAKKEARQMDEKAGALSSRYEAELEKVRREGGAEREKQRAEAARLEAKIMEEARIESARILEHGKERIAAEIAELAERDRRAEPRARARRLPRSSSSAR